MPPEGGTTYLSSDSFIGAHSTVSGSDGVAGCGTKNNKSYETIVFL